MYEKHLRITLKSQTLLLLFILCENITFVNVWISAPKGFLGLDARLH